MMYAALKNWVFGDRRSSFSLCEKAKGQCRSMPFCPLLRAPGTEHHVTAITRPRGGLTLSHGLSGSLRRSIFAPRFATHPTSKSLTNENRRILLLPREWEDQVTRFALQYFGARLPRVYVCGCYSAQILLPTGMQEHTVKEVD